LKIKRLVLSYLLVALFIILNGCGQKMPLPGVQSSPESFGANDTSYIHLNPIWDATTIGYNPAKSMTPVDIAIGDDGYLFVADSANNCILTISQSGQLVTHQNLGEIKPINGPIALDIDSKLNLLTVNGTNTIYVWNQYLNNIGVDSLLIDIKYESKLIFSADPNKIDSILAIHPFYVDANEQSSFQGVAFGPAKENTLFVTDKANNRILKLNLTLSGIVKLKNGQLHPTIRGVYEKDIATYGSGAGTVDNPRGITADDDGNLYFTQLGGNFFVQKLKKQGDKYISGYTLYDDPIMDLEQFIAPHDVAIGKNDAIFVLDTGDGKVYKFLNRGNKAGDKASLGNKGLAQAIFNRPFGIAISDEEMVYIADTGNHRIERYQFSVSEGDLPVEQP